MLQKHFGNGNVLGIDIGTFPFSTSLRSGNPLDSKHKFQAVTISGLTNGTAVFVLGLAFPATKRQGCDSRSRFKKLRFCYDLKTRLILAEDTHQDFSSVLLSLYRHVNLLPLESMAT